jgi:predicted PurR-regulated permease PerM
LALNDIIPRPALPLPATAAAREPSTLTILNVGVVAIAALYLGRTIFVPLIVAVLLGFALTPLVSWLRRRHFGRVASVLSAVLLAVLLLAGIAMMIGGQAVELIAALPQYENNISHKIQSLGGAANGSNFISRELKMFNDLSNDISRTATRATQSIAGNSAAPKGAKPVPVEIHQPGSNQAVTIFETVASPLLEPLGQTGLVIVFVVFLLLQREDLRDRFIRVAGAGDIRRTTHVIDEAAERVSRYLIAQTAVNASFGLIIAVGCWLIGVPNPALWGIVGALLRYLPYVGVPLAAVFPAALSIAVDPGWSMLFWTLGLFFVTEPIMGQIVEPYLYGQSTGLSPVAVIVAAMIWTWLWGPIGLILSTPLTVCLVVLGRHVDSLHFLYILMGDKPALAPEESFYQRVLAGDPDEVVGQAEDFLKEKSLAAYYDDVAIRGLALAQSDVLRGVLGDEQCVRMSEVVRQVVEATAHEAPKAAAESEDDAATSKSPVWGDKLVLCIAGRSFLDELAAEMLAALLRANGVRARVASNADVSVTKIAALDVSDVALACLSYLDQSNFTSARQIVRRLRSRLAPGTPVLVGFWTMKSEPVITSTVLNEPGSDSVAISLANAEEQIVAAAMNPSHRFWAVAAAQ